MATFKCKMCGGDLDINDGLTVCECEYCGTRQTLPKIDSEKKANLFDRANHFRRADDYDKAESIYEQILAEDGTDSEVYWSLVLCKYGISYVVDPATGKRVPTVNRMQLQSILTDENYKLALQYADPLQKTVYEEEARTINEIQKGISLISSKEEPFDVFICYKETDKEGNRTKDSVIANDLYYQLKQEGFKVFFARITLEDKLGSAYEPYIFAALNSAKVMVVLGTRPEYFGAVWVKNEWSRYLSLVSKSNGGKVLIPAYRDMDPYDLPEEFSHLQALDMSKLGFMQDLIRGIKKITGKADPVQTRSAAPAGGSGPNVESLLKRVFIFLEDGDFEGAHQYTEKVLDIDPENARAYLAKLMVKRRVTRKEALANCKAPFAADPDYMKIVRYDGKLADELAGYNKKIIDRNAAALYDQAVARMEAASSSAQYREAKENFLQMGDYRDAARLAEECLGRETYYGKKETLVSAKDNMQFRKYDEAEKQLVSILGFENADELLARCRADKISYNNAATYDVAKAMMVRGEYEKAAEKFNSIRGYKDSADQAAACRRAPIANAARGCIDLYRQLHNKEIECDRAKDEYEKVAKANNRKGLKIRLAIYHIIFIALLAIIIVSAVSAVNKGGQKALENMSGYVFILAAVLSLDYFAIVIANCRTRGGFHWVFLLFGAGIIAYFMSFGLLFGKIPESNYEREKRESAENARFKLENFIREKTPTGKAKDYVAAVHSDVLAKCESIRQLGGNCEPAVKAILNEERSLLSSCGYKSYV